MRIVKTVELSRHQGRYPVPMERIKEQLLIEAARGYFEKGKVELTELPIQEGDHTVTYEAVFYMYTQAEIAELAMKITEVVTKQLKEANE